MKKIRQNPKKYQLFKGKNWYYSLNNTQKGPFTEQEITEIYQKFKNSKIRFKLHS